MSDVVHEPELLDDGVHCRAHSRKLQECLAISEGDYWEIEAALRNEVSRRLDAERRLAEIAQIIDGVRDRMKFAPGFQQVPNDIETERIYRLAKGTE